MQQIDERLEAKLARFNPLTYQINGAAMEVYNALGSHLLEAVYGDALCIEFRRRGIPFQRETWINLWYGGEQLEHRYKADFVCYESIVVELKSTRCLLPEHEAQLIHYLHATHYECGLLLNFGASTLEHQCYFN